MSTVYDNRFYDTGALRWWDTRPATLSTQVPLNIRGLYTYIKPPYDDSRVYVNNFDVGPRGPVQNINDVMPHYG